MEFRHAIDRVAADNRQMRHPHHLYRALLDNRQLSQPSLVTGIPLGNLI